MMLQNAPHPSVTRSRRRISHRTIRWFVKVLLAQMCHNPSSEGITKDVDHGPEPITGKGEGRWGMSLSHSHKVLEFF